MSERQTIIELAWEKRAELSPEKAPAEVAAAVQAPKSLTVSAGEFDRRDAVVPVTVPEGSALGVWTLRDLECFRCG